MVVLLNLVVIVTLLITGSRINRHNPLYPFYWPGIILKISAGVMVGLLYTYYYSSGDSFSMFAEAIKLKNSAFVSFQSFVNIYLKGDYSGIDGYQYVFQPRAAFMSKILAILALFTHDNYWLSQIYLTIFSFACFWLLAGSVYAQLDNKWQAVIPTLFFPSVVFWSSGMLKESVAIGALAAVMAIVSEVYFSRKISSIKFILLLFVLFLVASLKYYYAAVLIVTVLTLFLTRIFLPRGAKIWVEVLAMVLVFTSFLGIASLSHINFWPSRFFSVIVDNYNQFQLKSSIDNLITFKAFKPTMMSFILHSPKALFAGLFYPLWSPSLNLVKLLAIIENWFLIVICFYSLKNFRLPESVDMRLLVWAMLLFTVISAIFITFSTPNIGTLVRYKIGYQFVFVILIVSNIRFTLKAP